MLPESPWLSPARISQQQCLEPSKLLARKQQASAVEETKHWRLTLHA